MILAGVQGFLQEIFGNDVIGAYNNEGLALQEIIFIILGVFVLSLVILGTYKRTYQTTVYNKSFAVSLPLLAMITAVIIISVSSNIILSLGMVGALSIVRFRTAIKNPLDTVYMFWAVGLGITAGAGLLLIAVISTLIIAIALFLLITLEVFVQSYFLIVRAEPSDEQLVKKEPQMVYDQATEQMVPEPVQATLEETVTKEISKIYGRYTLRNKTLKKNYEGNQLDLTFEVRSKKEKFTLINEIQQIEGVKSVILLSHQGDYITE